MARKNSEVLSKHLTISDMRKGGCIGPVIAIPFYIVFIMIFGAGDDALRLASYLMFTSGFVGLFGGLVEKLRNLKGIIAACVLSSILTFCLIAWLFIRNR